MLVLLGVGHWHEVNVRPGYDKNMSVPRESPRMPTPISATARLRAELHRLSQALEGAVFALPGEEAQMVDDDRNRARRLIDGYLDARLADPGAPLLVAIFGPTGGGKSTLLNSVAGIEVGEAGALRPTTRHPVYWVHRRNAGRLPAGADDRVVETEQEMAQALTLVDTPDLDSYLTEHRVRTHAVLDRCDAAIFVTTPQRYADAVPWDTLRSVLARRMPVLVVANRLSKRNRGAVTDLAGLLRKEGLKLSSDEIVSITEQRLRAGGLLAGAAIRRVVGYLQMLAFRPAESSLPVVAGTVEVVLGLSGTVRDEMDRLRSRAGELEALVKSAGKAQADEVSIHLDRGELVRQEIVARWQRIIGVSDLASIISRGWARARDLVRPAVEHEAVATVGDEVRDQLVELLVHRARLAHEQVLDGWMLEPGGRVIIADLAFDRDLASELAEAAVGHWQAELVELVANTGRDRFRLAKAASIGVNAAATLVLVGVFAQTGGLTGAEVGVVAGAAATQQAVLEHLFGSATAGSLARTGRRLLADLAQEVMAQSLDPLLTRLKSLVPTKAEVDEVSEAMRSVAGEARLALPAVAHG